jgi:hypothetical protein
MSSDQIKYVAPLAENITDVFLAPIGKNWINWTPIWSEERKKYLKVPIQRLSSPDSFLPWSDVFSRTDDSQGAGLVASPRHPAIVIDVDGVEIDTNPRLKAMLEAFPTYIEESPSGLENKFHIHYFLYSVHDKSLLRNNVTLKSKDEGEMLFYLG